MIGWCNDYDALFRGDYAEHGSIDKLANVALATGRVMLSVRGGGAKTVVLRRLASELLATAWVPFIVEVGRWSTAFAEDWQRAEGSSERLNMLLSRLGAVPSVSCRSHRIAIGLSLLWAVHPQGHRMTKRGYCSRGHS